MIGRVVTTLVFPEFENIEITSGSLPILRPGALIDFAARDQSDFKLAKESKPARVHGVYSIHSQAVKTLEDGTLAQIIVLHKYQPGHSIEIG